MCPPSSGSSGSRLNTPTKKFSRASSRTKYAQRPRSAASPPMIDAPTTLTGVFSSRSPPPRASHRAGIRSGNDRMPCQTFANIWPVKSKVAGTAESAPYSKIVCWPAPIAPTVIGAPSASSRCTGLTSTVRPSCSSPRSTTTGVGPSARPDGEDGVGPRRGRGAGDRDDPVAGLQPGRQGRLGYARGRTGPAPSATPGSPRSSARPRRACCAGSAGPSCDGQRVDQQHPDDEVGQRARREHDDSLPGGLAEERAWRLVRRDLVQRRHARRCRRTRRPGSP